mmetsp:Transcript_81169/g.194784  ORF Transcript_81169/g.194784 Transcript_81169/m.194784 type:complete len:206 (+) Transcript_81169:142-759(+)
MRAVTPALDALLISAPLRINAFIVSKCPFCAAKCKGSQASAASASAGIAGNSASTASVCPKVAAQCKAVRPFWSLPEASAPALSSFDTAAAWPLLAAQCKAWSPSPSAQLRSAPCASCALSRCRSPFSEAPSSAAGSAVSWSSSFSSPTMGYLLLKVKTQADRNALSAMFSGIFFDSSVSSSKEFFPRSLEASRPAKGAYLPSGP